jgi:hypothetical protein
MHGLGTQLASLLGGAARDCGCPDLHPVIHHDGTAATPGPRQLEAGTGQQRQRVGAAGARYEDQSAVGQLAGSRS